jgi:peroxiredoxin family protein
MTLSLLLLSGSYERAHYAFVLATGAAAIGRPVVLFAAGPGCRALLEDWSGLSDAALDATYKARGVAGLDELREAAAAFAVRMIACEAGLRTEALEDRPLIPGVGVAGVVTFLSQAADGQIVTL